METLGHPGHRPGNVLRAVLRNPRNGMEGAPGSERRGSLPREEPPTAPGIWERGASTLTPHSRPHVHMRHTQTRRLGPGHRDKRHTQTLTSHSAGRWDDRDRAAAAAAPGRSPLPGSGSAHTETDALLPTPLTPVVGAPYSRPHLNTEEAPTGPPANSITLRLHNGHFWSVICSTCAHTPHPHTCLCGYTPTRARVYLHAHARMCVLYPHAHSHGTHHCPHRCAQAHSHTCAQSHSHPPAHLSHVQSLISGFQGARVEARPARSWPSQAGSAPDKLPVSSNNHSTDTCRPHGSGALQVAPGARQVWAGRGWSGGKAAGGGACEVQGGGHAQLSRLERMRRRLGALRFLPPPQSLRECCPARGQG